MAVRKDPVVYFDEINESIEKILGYSSVGSFSMAAAVYKQFAVGQWLVRLEPVNQTRKGE